MRRWIRKLEMLIFAFLLAGSINMAGILWMMQTGGGATFFYLVAAFLFFLYANIMPLTGYREGGEGMGIRLRRLNRGRALILYTGLTSIVNIFWYIWLGQKMLLPGAGIKAAAFYLLAILLTLCGEGILLLNGSLHLMLTSVQMGIRYRIALCLLWWIPGVNLCLFIKLYKLAGAEYETELEKEELDAVRKENECCHTKYPILLVHGVFFRDMRFLNYWGRIPKELIRNGADVYYGNQQSAATVDVCGAELAERIREIVSETGCGKVNIIAHSKGGLDARYAISKCGMAPYTASLTTVNTPHRGCLFADYLLDKAPAGVRNFLAARYNHTLQKLGDSAPDFLGAVTDLTAGRCADRNKQLPDNGQVYYQSVASSMKRARSGRFPLNITYYLVKHFDGENDGLVSIESALWGNVYCILRHKKIRGISHGDMIDLNRENIPAFDVREFYVNLVRDLKEKGF
ncbi:MAG: triacylglycerol lipase [Blautia sp.]|nr:triacylglycerol lipase [Lachnoclostridium sp.]MCM1212056.1 triacylglycerol lipase [Blautia sp.]